MNIRKDQLWKVPVFCLAAGIVTYIVYLAVLFLMRMVSYPDWGRSAPSGGSLWWISPARWGGMASARW